MSLSAPLNPLLVGLSADRKHSVTVPIAYFVHRIALRHRRRLQRNSSKSHRINAFGLWDILAHKVQSPDCLRLRGIDGVYLMTLFGNTAVIVIPAPKKKRSLLPLLTAVFVLSYGLMTMLIVEQGAAIQSQGNLIKILSTDSHELWAMKGKAIGDKQMAKMQAQGGSQAPSAQDPSSKAQAQPGTQVHPQTPAGKTAKPQMQLPPVPASDLLDQRRALHSI